MTAPRAGAAAKTAITPQLIERMRQKLAAEGIVPRDGGQPVPLSFAQRQLWFLDRLAPGSLEYVVPLVVRLSGRLDVRALESALGAVVARHEALRTRFVSREGAEPVQVVDPPGRPHVELTDLSGIEAETVREGRARQLVDAEIRRPFDLERGPLLRVTAVRMSGDDHLLTVCLHHIVCDGWSLGVLLAELGELYAAATDGRAARLADLPVQYGDFAVWQHGRLRGEALERQLAFWRERLAGLEPLRLATDRPRPAVRSAAGGSVDFLVPAATSRALAELAQHAGTTLFMALLSVFQVLLGRYSGQDDVAVGTPVSGRDRPETAGLVGLFVNALVMRADLSANPTVRQLLAQVRERALAAYAHQDLPFERLVEELAPRRDPSRNPLFQAMLVLDEDAAAAGWELPGLTVRPVPADLGVTKFDLTMWMTGTADGLRGCLEYSADLFDRATAERIAGHFQTLLASAVTSPGSPVAELEMLSADERRQLLAQGYATAADRPRRCVHELFEEQAARAPGALAVTCGTRELTYGELNTRASQLARYLRDKGAGPETLIALCADRSPEMVIGILGILKAGAAYVPLDPGYPPQRLAYMLADAGASIVLTQDRLRDRVGGNVRAICLDTDWPAISAYTGRPPAPLVTPASAAYVIYTSGSTGAPKGVVITHHGLANYASWAMRAFDRGGDGMVLHSSLGADLTVTSVFLPLISGKTIRMAVEPDAIPGLAALLRDHGRDFSALKLTPAHLEALLAEFAPADTVETVRTVILGGEQLYPGSVSAWRKLVPEARIINEYGPTEATVGCVAFEVPADLPAGGVPIGRPVASARVFVLGRRLDLVPAGVAGELYISGPGLARGYHGRTGLTAERFVPCPFGPPGSRMYRTGDIARWREDGNLEFLGRGDDQVKVRGFRVELGEVEAVLGSHPAVGSCAVTLREDRPGDARLVAYVVATGTSAAAGDLKAYLRDRVPGHMVPGAFVALPALPLTAHGKVDRAALPAPEADQPGSGTQYAAPRDELEDVIARSWAEALGVARVGVHDNFFDLGGHSMTAIRAVALVREHQPEANLRQLMTHQTVAELAATLRRPAADARRLAVELSASAARGDLPVLFCVHPSGGFIHWYRRLARALEGSWRVVGIQAPGTEPGEGPVSDIPAMAERYWSELRSVAPGPYHILGWSLGAVVVHAMCARFPHEVSAAYLLDPPVLDASSRASFLERADLLGQADELWARGQRETGARRARLERRLRSLARRYGEQELDAVGLGKPNTARIPAAEATALGTYRAGRSDARAVLVTSEETAGARAQDRAGYLKFWQGLYAGELRVISVPGAHMEMTTRPRSLEPLLAELRERRNPPSHAALQ